MSAELKTVVAPKEATLKSLKTQTNTLMPVVIAKLEAVLMNERSTPTAIIAASNTIIKLHLHILEAERQSKFDTQIAELNDIKIKQARIEMGEDTVDAVSKSGLKPLDIVKPKNLS